MFKVDTSRSPSPSAALAQPQQRLAELPMGGTGIVAAVLGDPVLRRRLLEMGLVPGTAVTLLRRAPLGDPLIVHLRSYDVGLRTSEAQLVDLQ